ncbi:MAG: 2-amino-4-hydroxy-6-hydroxymethyldihydropteridine diphosphokinase [Ignavibacteria bacterium]|nr:2-amino-4-hydroxy-6-hydroxymethyldihydropteridine diphosphokinase [Ignavibacteria bacterium]
MAKVYLGFGSNKGDRLQFVKKAIFEIGSIEGTSVTKISKVYETKPWGIKEQNDFLNCVAEITTILEAEELATRLKVAEKIVGRTASSKWYEREIDIDLLFYANRIVNTESLRIPHAELENRNFVLVPLNEIAPDLVHPVSGKKISELLHDSGDDLGVTEFAELIPDEEILRLTQTQ